PSQRTPNWNPFHSDTPYKRDKQDWTKILGSTETRHTTETPVATPRSEHLPLPSNPDVQVDAVFQIYGSWLVVKMQGSLYVLDQKAAHQKILFEQYRRYLQSHSGVCQQLLFPRTIELSPAHAQQMLEITEDLHALGFDISHVGNHAFIVNGLPAELQRGDETLVLEQLLEDYLQTQGDVKLRKHDSLALSLARQTSVSANTILDQNSMESLVNQLFQLPEWHSTPDGKTIMVKFGTEFLMDLFRKQKR
ncbi:MAG: hypothetical protein JNL57_10865, partial [Bacteroidetes bacterium]|nr:hypothetical protein [Bacteroidota bacterium]